MIKIKKYDLNRVFTPSTSAKLTYVPRKIIESDFQKCLNIPGMQIVLYGHSGCGKTTLWKHILIQNKINYIKTSCTNTTTFNDLIINLIDQMDPFYTTEKTLKFMTSLSSDIQVKYESFKTNLGISTYKEDTSRYSRVVPIQLTIDRITEFLGILNSVWVIEDFHKVSEEEKLNISQVMKVFMDSGEEYPKVKIICIGAVASARELIKFDPELNNRLMEINVPFMSFDELSVLAGIGCKLMNIKIQDHSIIEKILFYSNGLASVCHQLFYDMCYERKIEFTPLFCKELTLDDFKKAIESNARKNSDKYNVYYEKIKLYTKKEKHIMKAIANIEKDVFSSEDILEQAYINMEKPKGIKIIEKERNIFELLISFTEDTVNVLIYNPEAENFWFADPFFRSFIKMMYALEEENEKILKRPKNLTISNNDFDIAFEQYYEYLNKRLEKMIKDRFNSYNDKS